MGISFSGHVTRVIPVEEQSQVGKVRREALSLATIASFGELDGGRVALAATEIATNVLRHGKGGRVQLSLIVGSQGLGVEVCGIDRGPGFSLAQCLPDGFSTAGSPGQGLGAIQRQSTVFEAWCDPSGAIVLSRIYAAESGSEDVPYGALRVPMRHEVVCGDGWHLTWEGPRLTATLIDGLGHGPQASDATELGVAAAAEAGTRSVDDVINRMHARMSRSRGGAAAVFAYDGATGRGQFAGIGNIAVTVLHGASSRGFPSHPGIVGAQFRRVQPFSFHAEPGSLLVMHSDGLQSRWSIGQYEGLLYRHPALVAAVLQRDFDRGRDDAGIIAIRLGGQA
jgi:anti-sigma regulatory factor (Ser/Thr protein kinase)